MDIPPNEIESTRKAAIVHYYHVLCCENIPSLRMMLISGMPGNPVNVFEREFKKNFYALFLLTCDKKELNKETVAKTRSWLNTAHKPKDKDMFDGLDIFDVYKSELFKVSVL